MNQYLLAQIKFSIGKFPASSQSNEPAFRMPIFLFNYSDRKLHGIFKAESDGEWEINPQGMLYFPDAVFLCAKQKRLLTW